MMTLNKESYTVLIEIILSPTQTMPFEGQVPQKITIHLHCFIFPIWVTVMTHDLVGRLRFCCEGNQLLRSQVDFEKQFVEA